MRILRNMKIRNKLVVPVVLQVLLLAASITFYFYIDYIIAEKERGSEAAAGITAGIRSMSVHISDYLNGKRSYDELSAEFLGILDEVKKNDYFRDKEKQKDFAGLDTQFKEIDAIVKDDIEIESQVMELTSFSIEQSEIYLREISRKLADKNLRTSVSDLERLVIAGAAVNTTSNFNVKVYFLQLKEKIDHASQLLTFLDESIKNAAADEKRLADTPFAQLPVKAQEANMEIKELVTRFVDNAKKCEQIKKSIFDVYDGLVKYVAKMELQQNVTVFGSIRTGVLTLSAVIGIIALLIIFLSLTVKRFITAPLLELNARAYDLAIGDVDITKRLHVESSDEIGELGGWFNKFLERLHQLILKVRDSSSDIHHATEEISNASGDLAHRTNEQAASITETSTTLEEFMRSVQQNTENSAEADMMLTSFNEEIQEKKTLIENVNNTMTEIFDSSKQIDSIIKVINDISFQTNLLALNAAVEAARAGDAGRGFAVVAAEVRNLAQKTSESSKSIQQIVMRNVESTQKGVTLVKDTASFFAEIVNMMGETVTRISNITNSSREQFIGIEQINKAIGHMDEVSTHNAALVEELSATAKTVKNNVVALEDLVKQFKLETSGKAKISDYSAEAESKEKDDKKDSRKPGKPAGKKVEKKIEKKTDHISEEKATGSAAKSKKKETADDAPAKSSASIKDDFFDIDSEEGFEEF
jgi:methyl-accepting chemotaxis protein